MSPRRDSGTDVVDAAGDSAVSDGAVGDGGSDGGNMCPPLEEIRTLNTYIGSDYIQIDRLSDTPDPMNPLLFSAADANLIGPSTSGYTMGNDGDSVSRSFPPAGSAFTFVDWADIGEPTDPMHPDPLRNHRITDGVNSEATTFPQGHNSCVAAGQIGLDKQDLTYIGAANNDAFVYLLVQRRDNNGDSGYLWVFTHDAPIEACDSDCSDGRRLRYNIKTGDVIVLGEFNPSKPTRLRVFRGNDTLPAGGTLLNAYEAINTDDTTLWTEVTSTAVTAANTTSTPPTVWGSTNVTAVTAGRLQHDIIAEAAVDIRTFIGSGTTCGAQFYGSVISRSSTSTTSDMKDLVGPAIFNFGSISAHPTVTQTCAQQLHLQGNATDQNGDPVMGATCSWIIDPGPNQFTATGCDTTFTFPMGTNPVGSHTVRLTTTGGSNSCSNTAGDQMITIPAAITVTPSASANCSSQLTYNAVPNGVAADAVSYAWTWTAPGTTANFMSTVQGETNRMVTPANTLYSGSVTITELMKRSTFDTVCSATGTTSATPYTALTASLAADRGSQSCGANPTTADADKIVYTLTVTGRDGTYPISGFPASCVGGAPTSVTVSMGTGTATCEINPSGDNTCTDVTIQVTVDDNQCTDPSTSNLRYRKVSRVCVCTVGDTDCESRCVLPM